MFEKEAEEYRESKRHKSFREDVGNIQIDYNAYLNNLANAFKDGAEFGYNKANEWHYVKDELPISDKDKYYFVVDKWNEPMIARFYEGVWSNYSTIEDIIAWKEIELPELTKELK